MLAAPRRLPSTPQVRSTAIVEPVKGTSIGGIRKLTCAARAVKAANPTTAAIDATRDFGRIRLARTGGVAVIVRLFLLLGGCTLLGMARGKAP